MLKVTPENRYFQTKDAVMRTVVPFYFQVLFNFVMFEKFEVLDLLVPAADALWSLICCHQVRELYCHNGDDDDGFGDGDNGDDLFVIMMVMVIMMVIFVIMMIMVTILVMVVVIMVVVMILVVVIMMMTIWVIMIMVVVMMILVIMMMVVMMILVSGDDDFGDYDEFGNDGGGDGDNFVDHDFRDIHSLIHLLFRRNTQLSSRNSWPHKGIL